MRNYKFMAEGDVFYVFLCQNNERVVKVPKTRLKKLAIKSIFSSCGKIWPLNLYYLAVRYFRLSEHTKRAERNIEIFLNQKNEILYKHIPKSEVCRGYLMLSFEQNNFDFNGYYIDQEFISQRKPNVAMIDTKGIIEFHHEMWRLGMGFSASAETWGPRNWGVSESGESVLFDFSHITMEKEEVSPIVTKETMMNRLSHALNKYDGEQHQKIRNYFEKMEREINPETFDRLWCERTVALS